MLKMNFNARIIIKPLSSEIYNIVGEQNSLHLEKQEKSLQQDERKVDMEAERTSVSHCLSTVKETIDSSFCSNNGIQGMHNGDSSNKTLSSSLQNSCEARNVSESTLGQKHAVGEFNTELSQERAGSHEIVKTTGVQSNGANREVVKKKVDPIHVRNFLLFNEYPNDCAGSYRRTIRRTAERNYKMVNESEFYYRKCCVDAPKHPQSIPEYHWRRVVFDENKRVAIVRNAHITPAGSHLSRKVTQVKVEGSFYWPDICHMVNHFISSCDVCRPMGIPKPPPYTSAIAINTLENGTPVKTVKKAYSNKSVSNGGALKCTMCAFRTQHKRDYVNHMFNFHVWKCKCGYAAKNGDLAAMHLTKCKESKMFTTVSKALRKLNGNKPMVKPGKNAADIERSSVSERTCGRCLGCNRIRNCGKCKHCMNRKNFGKRGVQKMCIKRRCLKIKKVKKKIRVENPHQCKSDRMFQRKMARDAMDILEMMDSIDTNGGLPHDTNVQSVSLPVDQDLFLDAELIDSLASQFVDQYQSEFTSRDPIEEATEQLNKLEARDVQMEEPLDLSFHTQSSLVDTSHAMKISSKTSQQSQTNVIGNSYDIVPKERANKNKNEAKIDSYVAKSSQNIGDDVGPLSTKRSATKTCCLPCLSGMDTDFTELEIQKLKLLASQKPTVADLQKWYLTLT